MRSDVINGQTGQRNIINIVREYDGYSLARAYTESSRIDGSSQFNYFSTLTPQYDANDRLVKTQRITKNYVNGEQVSHLDFENQYHYAPGSNNNMSQFTQIQNLPSQPLKRTIASFGPDDRLLNVQGSIARSYTYNDDGSMKTMSNCYGTTTYDYDVFGNLKKVELPDGKVVEYKVDAQNRRFKKLINGQVTEYYLWYDQIRLAAVLNPDRSVKFSYIYSPHSNNPLSMKKDGVTYQLLLDPGLASVRYVINGFTKETVSEIEYDEFGNILNNNNPHFQPLLYAGGLYDVDTKLYRFGARDYDPTIGRWTTKDPIGFAGGDTNLYAYVGGNPMSYSDPEGLMKLPVDPSGLPEGWWPDPTHKDPTGGRYRYKGTDRYLDYHPGNPDGKRGGKQKEGHWHDEQNDGRHKPRSAGDEVADPVEPCPPAKRTFDPNTVPLPVPLVLPGLPAWLPIR